MGEASVTNPWTREDYLKPSRGLTGLNDLEIKKKSMAVHTTEIQAQVGLKFMFSKFRGQIRVQ